MHVEIPSEFNPIVMQLIARGDYRNECEVVIAGLRLLQSREELRRDVDAGIAQLEAGLGIDGRKVFAELKEQARTFAEQKSV